MALTIMPRQRLPHFSLRGRFDSALNTLCL
jgi:hypothetical protein